MAFVRAPNPIWYLPDLTGEPLNDEYFAFFLTNTLPYVPQNVYRDPQGDTVWTGDVVQFYPNGTLPDNLYFDPDLVYRIEIRQGNSQLDPLIYEINNFVPDATQSIITDTSILTNENQISNPTFSQVLFSQPPGQSSPMLTITVAGTYQIAPGWFIDLVGAGSTTLTQVIWSADQNVTGDPVPAYALKIVNAGWTSATLRQRFNHNGGIWTNGAVAMSLVAMGVGSPVLLSMNYVPQPPGTPIPVINNITVPVAIFQTFSAAANLGQSTNTNLNNVSYVDIEIILPTNASVEISNVQVVGQVAPLDDPTIAPLPSFQQITEERTVDHLFHFYQYSLLRQGKDSLLTGWNFALNPWQFTTTTSTNVAANQYTADQTVMIQQAYVTSATGNNVAVGQAGVANDLAYQVTAVTATNQFGIVQYIDSGTVMPCWGFTMSSLVKAALVTSHGTTVGVKMRLFWKAGLPATVSQTDPVAAWTANGDPVFGSGYTGIAPQNDPVYILGGASGAVQEFAFEGFRLPAATSTSMTLGIMFYTAGSTNSASTADVICISDISLTRTDFAIATQPQTYDQVMRQCEYYYEKSYTKGTLPGAVTNIGDRSAPMRIWTDDNLYFSSFELIYNSVKRTAPAITFYSPTGNSGHMQAGILLNAAFSPTGPTNPADYSSTLWNAIGATEHSVFMQCNATSTLRTNGGGSGGDEGILIYQYVADARLGV